MALIQLIVFYFVILPPALLLSLTNSIAKERSKRSEIVRNSHRGSRSKYRGHHRWRQDDNKLDIDHADMEDTELVADLNQGIQFNDADHMKLIQGDILVHTKKLYKRGAVRPLEMLWPDGTIYYQFQPYLGPIKVQLVKSAMQHIMDFTCVQFKERKYNEPDFLNITKDRGCFSHVGKQGGAQELSVGGGCMTMGIIAHELAHAMGFYHEQSRPDRGSYVELIPENIKSDQLDNFEIRKNDEVNSMNVPYDYGSLMHYGLKDFSSNNKPTLRTLKTVPTGTVIGQRVRLSNQDIKQANLLYKCKKEPEISRSNRHSGAFDSISIVGGTQDTTQLLCLDGMTYRGNQVLVTMCHLRKSSLEWRWTDEYQLKNQGNTLCLSVQDNHTSGGQTDNVPIRMEACDPQEYRQKWMCEGGMLRNLALDKCINSAWKPYKRNYMISVTKCDAGDITQVISVFGSGKNYEPICRRWKMPGQATEQCTEEYPRKTYLGCRDQEVMLGFDKIGRGNNLRSIKAIRCCALYNRTTEVEHKSFKSVGRSGATECPSGYLIQGLALRPAQPGIRTKSVDKVNTLNALTYLTCTRFNNTSSYGNCYWEELRHKNINKGMNVCSRAGFYLAGIYRKRCSKLSCLKRFKCCSLDIYHNST